MYIVSMFEQTVHYGGGAGCVSEMAYFFDKY